MPAEPSAACSMGTGLVTREVLGKVCVLRLNNPAALNAMSNTMVEDLNAALDDMPMTVRAMVVGSTGRAFSSGADLAAPMGGEGVEALDVGRSLETHANPLMQRLRNLEIPWVSAVRGPAAGFGCSLALSADMVVASETAYFLLAFARIGLVPDGGATYLFARAAGRVRAMEAALLGDKIGASQAREWGLVSRVVADANLDREALDLAARLAEGPASLGLIRGAIWNSLDADFTRTLAEERCLQKMAGETADFAEGVKAFLEKRPAKFDGR